MPTVNVHCHFSSSRGNISKQLSSKFYFHFLQLKLHVPSVILFTGILIIVVCVETYAAVRQVAYSHQDMYYRSKLSIHTSEILM